MTNLLLITSEFPPQPGGIGNHAHHVARSLRTHNFKVTVLADQRSRKGEEEQRFDAAQKYTVFRVQRRALLLVTYLNRITKALKLAKQNEVILVSGKFSIWISGVLRFFSNKKMVAVIHGSEVAIPPSFKQGFTRWCLRRCNQVVAVSHFTASLVQSWGLKKVDVIPNGFVINTVTQQVSKSTEEVQLITVGNVTQRKGQHNVINALPLLLEHFPKLKYHIVGIPTERETVETLAKKLNVASAIVFHGKVSEEEKEKLLQKATIFIMLSETTATGDVEGFGIAILEANALRVPSIGSMGCGIEDAINNGSSGILVDAKNTVEVLGAVKTITENYFEYQNASRQWSENFTWDKISMQYANLLKP